MTTIHFEIDDVLLEKARKTAAERGLTLQDLMTLALSRSCITDPEQWFKELREATERLHGNSGGWKWNREEIYDRKVLR